MKKIFIMFFSLMLLLSCNNNSNSSKNYKNIVLVQGAMDIEVDTMIASLKDVKEERYGSWSFFVGTLEGKNGLNKVIVSRTEIGLVNASAATTMGIEKYKPTVIINQGTSGGHDINLHSGDIVLGTNIINIGAFRTEKSENTIQNNWIFLDDVQRLRDENNNFITNMAFHSDSDLVNIAKTINYTNGKVVEGTIGSADQWNRELERINMIHNKYNTSAEEMETVAAAQVAKAFNIPFIGIRILSNTDLHNEDFNPETAIWCNNFTIDFIKAL
ncbi:5'-methylthioadenosine nucleosidase [Brachyspira pilosicoli]|nr:5'-methylthioadenosine nucleosidase [Brachyspira pilosicoli]